MPFRNLESRGADSNRDGANLSDELTESKIMRSEAPFTIYWGMLLLIVTLVLTVRPYLTKLGECDPSVRI